MGGGTFKPLLVGLNHTGGGAFKPLCPDISDNTVSIHQCNNTMNHTISIAIDIVIIQ